MTSVSLCVTKNKNLHRVAQRIHRVAQSITFNFLNLETLSNMNLPYFIANRLIKGRREGTSFSRPINVIAIIGIAMGLAVMILAVAILTGFKQQIREKVVGFGSHIQIMNFDSNISFETTPISDTQKFIPKIKEDTGNFTYSGICHKSRDNKN